MKNNQVTCFLPCRKGSKRIPNKNIKPFANYHNGLIQIKLNQLINSKKIDNIVLSTNDKFIISYAEKINSKKIKIIRRSDDLCTDQTSTDELIDYAFNLIGEGHIIWTHVTSPFINASHYDKIIGTYFENLDNGFDSLMTANPIKSFLWQKRPINYDRNKEKWPRTQTLQPVYEINSAAFMVSYEIFKKFNDRIGNNPYIFEINKLIGHDIDWPEDFIIAEEFLKRKIVHI